MLAITIHEREKPPGVCRCELRDEETLCAALDFAIEGEAVRMLALREHTAIPNLESADALGRAALSFAEHRGARRALCGDAALGARLARCCGFELCGENWVLPDIAALFAQRCTAKPHGQP